MDTSRTPIGPAPAPTVIDLRSDPELKKRFELNEALSALIRRSWQYRLGFPDDLAPAPAQVMVIFALGKAYKTHRAILILCREGYGQDALVLLRSLLELAIDARYIAEDPLSDRAERWLDYDWVSRYELHRIYQSDAYFADLRSSEVNPVTGDASAELEQEARRVQAKWGFWEERRRDGRLGRVLHWAGKDADDRPMSVRKLAQAVGWESSYNTVYSFTSLTVHSSVRSANDYLEETPAGRERLNAGPGPQHVGLALDAWMYLQEVFKDWCKLLKVPQHLLDELAELESRYPPPPSQARL